MNELLPLHTLREALVKRETSVERSLNYVRAAVVVSAIGLDLLSAASRGLRSAEYFAFIGVVSVAVVAYLVAIQLLTRPGRSRPWMKYVTISVDFGLIAAFFAEMGTPGLRGRFDSNILAALGVSLILLIVVWSALRLSRMAILYSAALGVAFAAYLIIGFASNPLVRIWSIPVIVAAGAISYWISANVGSVIRALWREEKLKRFLSPQVVEMIEGSDLEVALGGVSTKVTVLFADIRGFTRFSESRTPEQIVEILNEHFTAMSRIIHQCGGMIDKYIGDAVMAVFGVPIAQPDDAGRAVRAASEMLAELARRNSAWGAEGREPISIGIALHTGVAVAGNIGSPERMDYTVIGDTVNVASRIEEMNKTFGTRLLMSESTAREVNRSIETKLVAETPMRGRDGTIKLFTLA